MVITYDLSDQNIQYYYAVFILPITYMCIDIHLHSFLFLQKIDKMQLPNAFCLKLTF